MGVPAFFRWLSRKFPKIITPVLEEEEQIINGVRIPASYGNPNPNGELDNLYLDMNGIVHPCSHPEDKPPPANEEEMLLAIFEYTDRVLNMARPRKVLMIAVDGVAPRAKMNQQRARRFKSARDKQIKDAEKERVALEMGQLIDDSIQTKTWDSNAITPGTPFMDKLAIGLRYWTAYKLATDPGWENLQVIISDATVPGEGEHKIMNFIRSQRSDTQYNPNTSHAIYGLDADLIFLGLATHEPHFRVLREDVFAQDQRSLSVRNQMHMSEDRKKHLQEYKKPFLWLNINVLREYLEVELNIPKLNFKFDLERAIDDWVFMCFFCGNDFLPHLPSLDVRDNSIDILVGIWKRLLPRLSSYLTTDGKLNLESVELLLSELGAQESSIFQNRKASDEQREAKRRRYQKPKDTVRADLLFDTSGNNVGELKLTNSDLARLKTQTFKQKQEEEEAKAKEAEVAEVEEVEELKEESSSSSANEETNSEPKQDINDANLNAAAAMRKKLLAGKKTTDTAVSSNGSETETSITAATRKRTIDSNNIEIDLLDPDPIKFHEAGYNERYYKVKFHLMDKTPEEIAEFKRQVITHYIEGISWVLLYYYQGCPSWNWYYPYHYAPFAQDFTDLKDIKVKFDKGEPFRPFEQLMSVLPADSDHNLPEVFRPLMRNEDSPIIDFYPTDFPLDMNGKKMEWQAIVLLPFIDEQRLLKHVQAKYELLTDEELERNERKKEVLFISSRNKNAERFKEVYTMDKIKIDFKFDSSGLAGTIEPNENYSMGTMMPSPIAGNERYPDISTDQFVKFDYTMPQAKLSKSLILTGYISHLLVLTQEDKDHIKYGGGGGGHYNRRFNPNNNFIKVGPFGNQHFKSRLGGFRHAVQMMLEEQQHQQNQQNFNKNFNQMRNSNQNYLPKPSGGGYLGSRK